MILQRFDLPIYLKTDDINLKQISLFCLPYALFSSHYIKTEVFY